MSDGGKGSGRRPQTAPDAQFAENWARTFAKNPDNTGVNTEDYAELTQPESNPQ